VPMSISTPSAGGVGKPLVSGVGKSGDTVVVGVGSFAAGFCRFATATVATLATFGRCPLSTVAKVAGIAVANAFFEHGQQTHGAVTSRSG